MKFLMLIAAALGLSACVFVNAETKGLVPGKGTEMKTDTFDGVSLLGGGEIIIRHGKTHTFLNTGSENAWKISTRDGDLILGCPDPCKGNKQRTAIITTPHLESLSLKGGGDIDIEGDFPDSDNFSIALQGGGDINAYAIDAKSVNVSIMGGGDIKVSASDTLNVSIMGGGDVSYRGSPDVTKSVLGGGDIHPDR